MKSIWTYTAWAGLTCLAVSNPCLAQPIGGTTPPPVKNQNPGTGSTQPPAKTDTPAASSTETNKDTAEKDPLVDAAAQLFRENKEEESYKKLLEASAKNEKLPPARLMMHRMYLSAGRAAEARRAIELAAVDQGVRDEVDFRLLFWSDIQLEADIEAWARTKSKEA
jgi:hypothetical protein